MGALELASATVRYGARTALDRVDLTVPAGERVALIGPNGSGKTTLLRALAGILRPDAGTARPAAGLTQRELALRVAFLPQEEHWEFPFPVEDVVACGRYAHAPGLFKEAVEDYAAVDTALAAVGLAPLRTRPITELSGGERRRVVLARALAQRAPALLLDEPTTALDLEHRHAVLTVLAGFSGTVVLATHDLDAAAAACERVVVLDAGRVVADGT
ncbi:MAG: ABC transporter ATP-binding protein, partial [Planctomycetota bacterium]